MLANELKKLQVLLEVVSVAEARRSELAAVFRPAPTSAPAEGHGDGGVGVGRCAQCGGRCGAVDLDGCRVSDRGVAQPVGAGQRRSGSSLP